MGEPAMHSLQFCCDISPEAGESACRRLTQISVSTVSTGRSHRVSAGFGRVCIIFGARCNLWHLYSNKCRPGTVKLGTKMYSKLCKQIMLHAIDYYDSIKPVYRSD